MTRLLEAGGLLGLIVGGALAHVAMLRLPSSNPLASELAAMTALTGVCCAGMAVIMRQCESRLLIFMVVLFSTPILLIIPALVLSNMMR